MKQIVHSVPPDQMLAVDVSKKFAPGIKSIYRGSVKDRLLMP
jgi:hypothetical protein